MAGSDPHATDHRHGLLAFALPVFGVYSLAMYSAIRRRREFSLRSALGATGSQLLATMLRDTMRPAVFGTVAGLAGAYAIARTMNAFLYGTKALEPIVYVTAWLLMLGVAALVSGAGGRRALNAELAEVLRGV